MTSDFGKAFGDDMLEGDMAAFDGMGMGGEFGPDTREAEMARAEGMIEVEMAAEDGMSPGRDGIEIDLSGLDF